MRKIITLLPVLALFVAIVGCSSVNSTPTSVVKEYAECLKGGEYEDIAELFYYDESNPEKAAENKDMIKGVFTEKVKPGVEKQDGFKSYEITSETISEDGQSAIVEYTFEFNNGKVEEEKADLIKVDGKWYLFVGK